jgi:hypothetical protein
MPPNSGDGPGKTSHAFAIDSQSAWPWLSVVPRIGCGVTLNSLGRSDGPTNATPAPIFSQSATTAFGGA